MFNAEACTGLEVSQKKIKFKAKACRSLQRKNF